MRTGLALAVAGLALAACAGMTDPLPRGFDGIWDLTPAACADPDGLTRLSVAGATLEYYEWGGEVRAARPRHDGSVAVDMDWTDVSDTDLNERPIVRRVSGALTLSPDGSNLRTRIFDETRAYVRCPQD